MQAFHPRHAGYIGGNSEGNQTQEDFGHDPIPPHRQQKLCHAWFSHTWIDGYVYYIGSPPSHVNSQEWQTPLVVNGQNCAWVRGYVRSCQKCQSCHSMPAMAPLHPWLWPSLPWQRIHVDYAGPVDGRMLLVIVDGGLRSFQCPLLHLSALCVCSRKP